jgi:hypothetical protein
MASVFYGSPMSSFESSTIPSSGPYRGGHDAESVTIGLSFMRFEAPDTCFVNYIGDLDGEIVSAMNSALVRISSRLARFFLLVDLSRTGVVSDVARRSGVSGMRALNPCGTAVFGADFHRRVIATLITKAAAVIDARIKGPVSFFAREAEARVWLGHLRRNVPRLRA